MCDDGFDLNHDICKIMFQNRYFYICKIQVIFQLIEYFHEHVKIAGLDVICNPLGICIMQGMRLRVALAVLGKFGKSKNMLIWTAEKSSFHEFGCVMEGGMDLFDCIYRMAVSEEQRIQWRALLRLTDIAVQKFLKTVQGEVAFQQNNIHIFQSDIVQRVMIFVGKTQDIRKIPGSLKGFLIIICVDHNLINGGFQSHIMIVKIGVICFIQKDILQNRISGFGAVFYELFLRTLFFCESFFCFQDSFFEFIFIDWFCKITGNSVFDCFLCIGEI